MPDHTEPGWSILKTLAGFSSGWFVFDTHFNLARTNLTTLRGRYVLCVAYYLMHSFVYLMGVAQAPTPATKNYTVEKPLWTFVEHYSTKVHRVCSALGQQPA